MSAKIRLLIVDDEEMFQKLLIERFSKDEFEAVGCLSGEDALEKIKGNTFDVGIIDMRMPGINGIDLFKAIKKSSPYFEAIILTGAATVDTAIEAMKHGVYDYLTKPCKLFELELIVRKAYEKRQLELENDRLKNSLALQNQEYGLDGKSDHMTALRESLKLASGSSSPLLITGEAGTGKQYFAKCVHHESLGKESPFITVSCGIFAQGMLENHLFGHEKDTFAGMPGSSAGWLSLASGGTLFLQNVDELPISTQVKLASFLETGTFQRAGGNGEYRSSARVIASTRKNLHEMATKKLFSEDLYYKLSVMMVDISSLREHKEDIPNLVGKIMRRKAGSSHSKKFSNKTINAMLKYDWPGNIRELVNAVEHAVIASGKKTVQAKDMPIFVSSKHAKNKDRHLLSLEDVERDHILYVLSATGGNISRAARSLGISRPKLYRKISYYKTGSKE